MEPHLAPHVNAALLGRWVEEGGPPVNLPSRRGFGSTVMENMVKLGLGADFHLDYRPEGLAWRLSCAALRVLEGANLW